MVRTKFDVKNTVPLNISRTLAKITCFQYFTVLQPPQQSLQQPTPAPAPAPAPAPVRRTGFSIEDIMRR